PSGVPAGGSPSAKIARAVSSLAPRAGCSGSPLTVFWDVDRVLDRGEDLTNHGLELLEPHTLVFRVECRLIVYGAEVFRVCVPRVIAELIPHVPIEPEVVEEVVTLEDRMLFDHPMVLFGDERLQDRRPDVGVIARSQDVAHVV